MIGGSLQVGTGSGGVLQPGGGGGLAGLGGAGAGSGATVNKPVGVVTIGVAAESGGKVANAHAVIAGMKAGFRRCYNRQLAKDPSAAGSVRLKVSIGPHGEVLGVTPYLPQGLGSEVLSCVTARIAAAQFAPPEGGSATLEINAAFAKAAVPP